MLERVWRKGNPLTLLVRMYTGAATMENTMEVSQNKLKIESPYDPAVSPTSGHHLVFAKGQRGWGEGVGGWDLQM